MKLIVQEEKIKIMIKDMVMEKAMEIKMDMEIMKIMVMDMEIMEDMGEKEVIERNKLIKSYNDNIMICFLLILIY